MTERKYYTGIMTENSQTPKYTFETNTGEYFVLIFSVEPDQRIKDQFFNRVVRVSMEETGSNYVRSKQKEDLPDLPDLPVMNVCNHARWVREV